MSVKVTNLIGIATEFKYGDLISNIIDFLIIALIVFLAYKQLSKYKNQNGIIFALTDSDTMNTAIDASGKKTTMIQGKREKQMFNYTNCMDR